MFFSEQNIISRFQAKDKSVFDTIYDNYAPNLFGVVLNMLGDEKEAEDVIQNSFVKIWQNADRYDPKKAKLFTWMLNICRNAAIDILRKRDISRKHKNQYQSESVYKNVSISYNADIIDVRKHVNALDEKYRRVLNAIYFEGLSQKEASERLEVPLGTIKTRLKAALQKLSIIFNQADLILVLSVWMNV